MNTIIIDKYPVKLDFKSLMYFMFIANPWSWAYMLLGQLIGFVVFRMKSFLTYLNQSVLMPYYIAAFAIVFVLILWKILVLYMRKKKINTSVDPDAKVLTSIKFWLIDTAGDIILAIFGSSIIITAGLLL